MFIAHRMCTVAGSDKIVILADGVVQCEQRRAKRAAELRLLRHEDRLAELFLQSPHHAAAEARATEKAKAENM